MSKPRVAILGLGIMGGGMAGRLAANGFPLAVYNRSRDKAAALGKAGAFVADSPREAASRADVVISMVADDDASRGMWLGENGALAGAAPGTILIESSTLTVNWIRALAAAAREKQCEFLDAPVTGTKPHAAAGELNFLVGGSAAAIEKVRPVFSVLGQNVIHLGPTGSGALLKLVNNFICGVQAASFAEGVAMIEAGGLDAAKAFPILLNGAPGSPMVKRVCERFVAGDSTPNFVLSLMAKDIRYAIEEAAHQKISLKTAASALAVFEQAVKKGHGNEDVSAVVKSLQRN